TRDVHLGVVHEAQASEVRIARALGDLVTLSEVALRFVEPLPVRTRHAEVVVGDRAPVLVVRLAVGLERAPVARQRFVEVALDVREDPQVLLGPGTELAAVPAQLQRAQEVAPRVADGVGLQVDPAERVERFRREQVAPRGVGHGVTGVAEPSRLVRFVAMVADDREAAQRFGEQRGLSRALGRRDRALVRRDGVRDAGGALLRPRIVEQVRRGADRPAGACLHGVASQRGGHGDLTRRWRGWGSGPPGPSHSGWRGYPATGRSWGWCAHLGYAGRDPTGSSR